VTTTASMVAIVMVGTGLSGVRSNQTEHCRCSHESTLHGYSLLKGRSRFHDQEAAGGKALKVPSGAV
jgi:hypothetical protein